MGGQPLTVLREHLQVVLEQHRLPVEQEVPEVRVVVELVEHAADHAAHVDPEAVERLIPLAVPVRVGDDGDELGLRQSREFLCVPASHRADTDYCGTYCCHCLVASS